MAEINYGQLADAIVDAIQRTRATGTADDPVSLLADSLSKSVSDFSKGNKTSQDKVTASQDSLKKITSVLANKLIQVSARLASEVLVLQRQGLAFNKDFTQTTRLAGERIRGLPGGLKQSLESLFDFQKIGMMNTGRETLKLANRMRITGQNVQGLAQMDKMLLTQGLLGTNQRDRLIQTVGDSALSYGVAADQIVESVNNLARSMDLLGITGGAGAMAEQIAKLTAESPALGQQATMLVNSLVDAVKSGDMGQIYRLGLSEEVDKMLAGTGDLMTLIQKTSEGSIKAMGGIGTQGKEFISAQLAVVGQVGFLGEQLQRATSLNEKQTKGKSISQLGADFMTAFNEALEPLQMEIGDVVTKIAKFAAGIVKFVSAIGGTKPILIGLLAIISNKLIRSLHFVWQALRFMGTKAMGTQIGSSVANALSPIRKGGGSMMRAAGPWAAAIAIVAVGMPALINWSKKSTEVEEAQLALMEKTYEANQFQRKELGRSRFEEMSKMLINQNLLAATVSQAAFAEGNADAGQQRLDALHRITAELEGGLPGKPEIDKRGTSPK